MKKFGIRALACSLAVMMIAGLGAPITASAQDDLLVTTIAKNEPKVLELTADMVDEDGEIVISGGTYDRIVVSKEAAASDIYFDQVKVSELVVESGNKAKIQLWEVDAEKVTVKEPELVNLDLNELLPLFANPEFIEAAEKIYNESVAKDNYALSTAPTIVTMDDAKVKELVVRANAKLDLGAGDVDVVALEASDEVERVKVTLSNYNGDVTYKGTENFNSITLNNVDSRINSLKIEDSNAKNYLTVNGKDSAVMKAEVAGGANVVLNAPMAIVEVTEAAKDAKVSILNAAEELNVAAEGADIDLTAYANVTMATVTSDNVRITGDGYLGEADLQGEGAYVSTFNTKVEGENTYVRPVYVPQQVVITDIDLEGGDLAVVTKNADGSSTVVYKPKYQTARFMVPDSIDKDRISSVSIEVSYNGQFCVKFGGTSKGDVYPGYGATTLTNETLEYPINCAKDKLAYLDFMCLEAPVEVTVKKITFNLLDKAPEAEPEPEAVAPGELSDDYVVYGVADLTKGGYGFDATEALYGGEHVALGASYQEVRYTFAEDIDLSKYKEMILTFATKSKADSIGIRLVNKAADTDEWGNPVPFETLNVTTDNTEDYVIDLAKYAGQKLTWVAFVSANNETEVTFYRIALLPKEGGSGNQGGSEGEGGNQGGTEDGTACSSDNYVVHNFTDYDLSEYAGSTVKITVKLKKAGGADTVKAYAQTSGTYAWISTAVIGNEWEEYVISYDVPKDCKNTEYIGFRKINDGDEVQDYTGCTFYYKDLVFEGTKTSGGDEGGSGSGEVEKVTVTIATLEKTELTVGETLTLKATASVSGSAITWSSSNPDIAKVSDAGEVLAVSAGKATITASCGEAKATIELIVVEAEVITEFFVIKDEAFNDIDVVNNNGNVVAQLDPINLAGDILVNKLPTALQGDAASYKTLSGIMSKIDYFEFTVTLTEGTPKEGLKDGIYWAPQAQIQAQSTNYDEGTWNLGLTDEQNATLCANLGQATESTPKTGSGKLYTEYFDGWTSKDQYSLNMLQIQFLNAEEGSVVSGTYSIKAVLK